MTIKTLECANYEREVKNIAETSKTMIELLDRTSKLIGAMFVDNNLTWDFDKFQVSRGFWKGQIRIGSTMSNILGENLSTLLQTLYKLTNEENKKFEFEDFKDVIRDVILDYAVDLW